MIFCSKIKQPFCLPQKAKAEAANAAALKAEEESAKQQLSAKDKKCTHRFKNSGSDDAETAPCAEDGELVVQQREIHL